MAFNQILKVTSKSKIAQKELFAADTSSASGQNPFYKSSDRVMGTESKVGSDAPYVMINGAPITEIGLLILSESGTLPTIKIIFKDTDGALSGPNYPKNDPILSLYMKTSSETLKPIRIDFLITSIKSDQDAIRDAESMGTSAEFIMTGELFVPKIYNNFSKAYKNMGSKEALKKLAADLDLGFSENDGGTSDTMTWINPNRNGLYFMNHIANHSYLDDDTFFDCFVDKFFNLTFVNITQQLMTSRELDLTPEQRVDPSELEMTREIKTRENEKSVNDSLAVLQLTNNQRFQGRSEFINSYSLLGDIGSVLKNKGYRKRIYYYDHLLDGEDKFTSFYVNPISVKGLNEGTRLVPANESLKAHTVNKWINIDYGNTHREWNAASLINDHNKAELNKVKLKAETAGINLQVIRGSSIKVNMFTFKDAAINRSSQISDKPKAQPNSLDSNEQAEQIPDPVLSGTYYVSGIKYIYDPTDDISFKTEFSLCRMNWLSENIID
jgi:hypothetical protein